MKFLALAVAVALAACATLPRPHWNTQALPSPSPLAIFNTNSGIPAMQSANLQGDNYAADPTIEATAGDMNGPALIDTGATLTVLPQVVIDHLMSQHKARLDPAGPQTLELADGRGVSYQLYDVTAGVGIGTCIFTRTLYIVAANTDRMTIGMDMLADLEPWVLDTHSGKFLFTCPKDRT